MIQPSGSRSWEEPRCRRMEAAGSCMTRVEVLKNNYRGPGQMMKIVVIASFCQGFTTPRDGTPPVINPCRSVPSL